jgi:hypothetical protein
MGNIMLIARQKPDGHSLSPIRGSERERRITTVNFRLAHDPGTIGTTAKIIGRITKRHGATSRRSIDGVSLQPDSV